MEIFLWLLRQRLLHLTYLSNAQSLARQGTSVDSHQRCRISVACQVMLFNPRLGRVEAHSPHNSGKLACLPPENRPPASHLPKRRCQNRSSQTGP